MGRFDFERFNGFAKNKLDDLLFEDLWHHDIFNESDLHSAAYSYISEYFKRKGRDHIYVRCEPSLAGMRPDIVIFDEFKPIYALELKFFDKVDKIDEDKIIHDLDKLSEMAEGIDSMKWGFFYLAYDGVEPYKLSAGKLRRGGYDKISVQTINLRRREDTGRRRTGYDEWRVAFDELLMRHKEYA